MPGLVRVKDDTAEPMKNYASLSSRVLAATPSAALASGYKPTNTPPACPEVGRKWAAASHALPRTPNAELCRCLADALTCVPVQGLSGGAREEIFSFICGLPDRFCEEIASNASAGEYGRFSICSAEEKLGLVLTTYHEHQELEASACDFDGRARQVVDQKPVTDRCRALFDERMG
jgi:hypothetical protein